MENNSGLNVRSYLFAPTKQQLPRNVLKILFPKLYKIKRKVEKRLVWLCKLSPKLICYTTRLMNEDPRKLAVDIAKEVNYNQMYLEQDKLTWLMTWRKQLLNSRYKTNCTEK